MGIFLAVGAQTVEYQVIGLDGEILFLFESKKERGYQIVVQLKDMTAVETHQVVVRGFIEPLINRRAGAHIRYRDELVLYQVIQRAVDGGEIEGGQPVDELFVDLGCGEVLAGILEDLK
jgi:hypothetical protein